jgi:UTP--glucose-1-phosphate uridylyltransferase
MKCVIPAAGLGTRFLPATKAQPKEMLPIVDKPAIQYVVEEAVASGIEDILIITGREKGSIENHFDRALNLEQTLQEKGNHAALKILDETTYTSNKIFYIRQSTPRGLGDAVLHAKQHVHDDDFAVLLGDDIIVNDVPATKQLIDVFNKHGGPVIGLEVMPKEDVHRYGVIKGTEIGDDVYHVDDIVEKPAPGTEPSNLTVMGRYLLVPEIFPMLERVQPGVNGEIQLTDALKELCQSMDVYAYIMQGKRYDIGTKIGWLKANIEMALGREDLSVEVKRYLASIGL